MLDAFRGRRGVEYKLCWNVYFRMCLRSNFINWEKLSQDVVHISGRVACDSIGKLNSQSVVLEGSRQLSQGRQIAVDLSELTEYALFPGQVGTMLFFFLCVSVPDKVLHNWLIKCCCAIFIITFFRLHSFYICVPLKNNFDRKVSFFTFTFSLFNTIHLWTREKIWLRCKLMKVKAIVPAAQLQKSENFLSW